MTNLVTPLPFKGDLIDYLNVHGHAIEWLWHNGEAFIAVKPICEILGLSWSRQRKQLTDAKNDAVVAYKATTGADGKHYEMLCVAYPDFMMWLAGISVNRVKPEAREAVRATRNEIKLLIANYYHNRLFGEIQSYSRLLEKLRMDALQRKPLRWRVLHAVEKSWSFDQLYQSGSTSRPKLVQTIADMLKLGLIEQVPEGTPYNHSNSAHQLELRYETR